jgi:hypothetical protein
LPGGSSTVALAFLRMNRHHGGARALAGRSREVVLDH